MNNVELKEVEVTKLDPNATYLLQIDCTNMPVEKIQNIVNGLKSNLEKFNLTKFIIYPYKHQNEKIEVVELKGE